MKVLIGMVGLPRSGKTTYARSLGVPIVCPDEIRKALHGHRFIAVAEPFVWAIAKIMVRALFSAGHGVVCLDATNHSEKRRQDWESPNEWRTEWRNILTSKAECLRRATEMGDAEIVPIIERMAMDLTWAPDGSSTPE